MTEQHARPYKKALLEDLKFALEIGRAGLRMWDSRSKNYKRVQTEIAAIEAELFTRDHEAIYTQTGEQHALANHSSLPRR
jgi:hypothetical protein